MKDIHHVIKHTKFGDDRLRGSGVVAGQISASPIDFAGRPYNTLTLPCERVIISKASETDLRNGKVSVRPSVCPSMDRREQTQSCRFAVGLVGAGKRYRSIATAEACGGRMWAVPRCQRT